MSKRVACGQIANQSVSRRQQPLLARANKDVGGGYLAHIEHVECELLRSIPVWIENCRRVSPLCALHGARAVLHQVRVVTSERTVGAHIDVRIPVRSVL